jgi:hypothetical protein
LDATPQREAKEGSVTYTSRLINRTTALLALVATVLLLALTAMTGAGPVGNGVGKPSVSDLGLSIGGKTVSGSPSRRK